MTLFDHINNLIYKNKKWEDFTEEECKSFNVYMINKFISMKPEYTDVVNQIQHYTGDLSAQTIFNFYYNLLPKKKTYFKYIKGNKVEIDQNIVDILCLHFECGEKHILEYMNLLSSEQIKEILNKYGFDNPTIKKKNVKKSKK
jgi:hypothetical protein